VNLYIKKMLQKYYEKSLKPKDEEIYLFREKLSNITSEATREELIGIIECICEEYEAMKRMYETGREMNDFFREIDRKKEEMGL